MLLRSWYGCQERTNFAITSTRDGWISSVELWNKNQAMAGQRMCIQRTLNAACKPMSATATLAVHLRCSIACGITPDNIVGFLTVGCPATRRMGPLRGMLEDVSIFTPKKRQQKRFGLPTRQYA